MGMNKYSVLAGCGAPSLAVLLAPLRRLSLSLSPFLLRVVPACLPWCGAEDLSVISLDRQPAKVYSEHMANTQAASGKLTRMTLADGRVFERSVPATKRAGQVTYNMSGWCSALMSLAPYGTDFRGATFEVVK